MKVKSEQNLYDLISALSFDKSASSFATRFCFTPVDTLSLSLSLSLSQGYSTALRTMTSGTGTFVSRFSHYEPVTQDQERVIVQDLRGYYN